MAEEINTPSHPLNLAAFRIAVFSGILWLLFDSEIVLYSRLPADYLLPPLGLTEILPYVPINPTLVASAKAALTIVCVTGLLGLFSRFSALAATLLGLYVLGVPNFFGKVNHYHFLLWFTAILAASRSGDALSLDAVVRAWRRAPQRVYETPGPSVAYGAPLRFVWITMGLIYLFPGFWKMLPDGAWVSGDSIRYILYRKWLQVPDLPQWRIDLWPDEILAAMAAGAALFELSFLFLVAFPRTRLLAVCSGLAFHNVNGLILGIYFTPLQFCYVAFLDISEWCRRLGTKLFPDTATLLYDGNCLFCRRAIGIIRVFDVFERLTYVNLLDDEHVHRLQLPEVDKQSWIRDIHLMTPQKTFKGYDAYRQVAGRIPILWPLAPLLYVGLLERIGARVYRRVADSRTCSVSLGAAGGPRTAADRVPLVRDRVPRLVAWTGNLILAGAALTGFLRMEVSWPFACFPIFGHYVAAESMVFTIHSVESDGSESPIDDTVIREQFRPERFGILLSNVAAVGIETGEATQFQRFWRLAAELDPRLLSVRKVRFYRVMLRVHPDERHLNPADKDLILELPTGL